MRQNSSSPRSAFLVVTALAAAALATPASAQSTAAQPGTQRAALDEVRPFYSWKEDATVADGLRLEPNLTWGDFGNASEFTLGLLGGGEVITGLELGGDLHFVSIDVDGTDGNSGVSDLTLYGRYKIYEDELRVFLGAVADLPVGSEDVGASTFDFELFGAVRYTLQNDMVLFGNLGIESLETGFSGDDRENGLMLGTGVLWPASSHVSLVGELDIRPQDFSIFGAGVDYQLLSGSHLRGGIGLGLDDGAPDVQLNLSWATLLGGGGMQ